MSVKICVEKPKEIEDKIIKKIIITYFLDRIPRFNSFSTNTVILRTLYNQYKKIIVAINGDLVK